VRISAKTRYGIAALIHLAQNSTEDRLVPILSISEALGISKIYLEQVFSLLKRGDIVVSVKGPRVGTCFQDLQTRLRCLRYSRQ